MGPCVPAHPFLATRSPPTPKFGCVAMPGPTKAFVGGVRWCHHLVGAAFAWLWHMAQPLGAPPCTCPPPHKAPVHPIGSPTAPIWGKFPRTFLEISWKAPAIACFGAPQPWPPCQCHHGHARRALGWRWPHSQFLARGAWQFPGSFPEPPSKCFQAKLHHQWGQGSPNLSAPPPPPMGSVHAAHVAPF